jgi:WD40 repeat protein/putative methionine-R-sulfoxide reductase with GAF domain
MATPGAEFTTLRRKVPRTPSLQGATDAELEAELQELEKEIASDRDRPISALLMEVVERIGLLTGADGAAIAVRDQSDVICRASVGQAPEVGSQLRPDSALTRECFETGQVVVCEDTETDYRVRRSTAKSLRLRSAVVVPLQTRGSVLGVIEVLSSRPSAFSTTHVAGLQRIGELLAAVLTPTPVSPVQSEPLKGSILTSAPARPQEEYEETVLAPVPTFAPPEKPRPRLNAFLVVGAVFLLLLPLLYLAVVRNRQARAPATPVAQPASIPKAPAESAAQQQSTPPETTEASILIVHRNPETSAPITSPPLSTPSTQLPPKPTVTVPEEELTSESQAVPIIRPALPALVIQGTPPGTQIFVDDQLVASTNPGGEASISTLSAGQHRLRLRLNGYRDYDQDVEVQPGMTSTITAKLDPLELPTLSERAKAPILAATPAIPAPVTSTRLSAPNFALDRTLKAHSGWVTAIAFSPDGQRLASGSWDRTVKFWEVTSGEQLSAVAGKMKEVQSLAFSHDGHWLATENSSNTVALRDPITGLEIRALPSDKPLGALGSNWVYSIAFSPDGQWLASGVDDKTVRLWDVKTGQKVRDLTGLRRPVIYIAFSPDGRLLATGDDEKNIRIWDAASGEEIYKLSGHKKPVNAVAFSPDGRWLASASADKTVKLWDLAIGHEVHTLTGHGNVVTSLAFSPDGRWLASGSWDKTIKIWDVGTGREVQTLAGHDHPVYSVAFDSRGHWLASGSEDGTIKLWRLGNTAERSESRR